MVSSHDGLTLGAIFTVLNLTKEEFTLEVMSYLVYRNLFDVLTRFMMRFNLTLTLAESVTLYLSNLIPYNGLSITELLFLLLRDNPDVLNYGANNITVFHYFQ